MSVTQQQDTGGEAGQHRPRPVLFVHIPRAAGGSFALTIRNVFGDNRVRQVDYLDERTQQAIDDLVRDELDGIACLTGRLPLHLFDASLERFDPFTVLRDPVARVLSVYRFVKQEGEAERERLQLPEGFSLGDFLGSRLPELYGQINNGMVRMLCGDVTLTDPDFQEYWEIASAPNALVSALANLRRMEFGLAEEVGRTLALMQVRWSIPYPLMEIRENASEPDTAGEDVADLHQIIACNTMDLALYQRARTLFRERIGTLRGAAVSIGVNPRSVFDPALNQEVAVGDIPGRQGFHAFEPNGLAWLREDHAAELRFVSAGDLVRLRLHVYCMTDFYPVGDIVLTVNEHPLRVAVTPAEERWFDLETEHFETVAGINRITIRAPLFIPVRDLTPGTSDERSLGIALSGLLIGP